jgi:hypothetical protein
MALKMVFWHICHCKWQFSAYESLLPFFFDKIIEETVTRINAHKNIGENNIAIFGVQKSADWPTPGGRQTRLQTSKFLRGLADRPGISLKMSFPDPGGAKIMWITIGKNQIFDFFCSTNKEEKVKNFDILKKKIDFFFDQKKIVRSV